MKKAISLLPFLPTAVIKGGHPLARHFFVQNVLQVVNKTGHLAFYFFT